MNPLSDNADRPDGFQRVAQALRELGHAHAPVWRDVAARTSQEAADALGIAVGQIAKSVIFRRRSDDRAVPVPMVSAMPTCCTPMSFISRTTRSTSSSGTSPW